MNFGFGGVEQSELSLSYMYGMKNFGGYGSGKETPLMKSYMHGGVNYMGGGSIHGYQFTKTDNSKGGSTGVKGIKSLKYLNFDRNVLLSLLQNVLKKKEYKAGISLTDMYGEYAKAESEKGTKEKMFPFLTFRDKFSIRKNRFSFRWVEDRIKIVSCVKGTRVSKGKMIIKMKKR